MIRFLDAQADWIRRVFTPCQQTRLGVIMVDLGLMLAIGWWFIAPTEPPVVYQMSALALIFGGVGVVVTAVLAEKEESDD